METDYSESLPLLGNLPKHWGVVEFGSILDGGTRNGIYKKKEFHGKGDKIVNMGELFAFPRLLSVPMKRVELSAKEQEKFRLQEGDLLFARRSLVAEGAGKCSLVCEVKEPTTFESSIIRARPNSDRASSLYMFYLFRSPYGTYILDTIRRQVAVSGITGTDLVKLPIPLPPLHEQKEIARILGTLDDKIELNQQMNRTLEGIARALFKSWFIDFDPVRAKLDGRQPYGMDAETAALFPNSFDDSPLGKIPKGWITTSIEELADRVAMGPFGSNIKVSTFVPEGIPIISGQHLNGTLLEDKKYNFITLEHAEKLNKSNVYRGDIIFTHAGSIGQVALIPETSRYNRYVLSQRQFYMRCDRSKISPLFMIYFFKTPEGQHKLLANTSSTGVPSISRPVTYLRSIKVTIPAKQVSDAFEGLIQPLFLLIGKNIAQANTLITTRDLLLLKLLSGEIRIKEAEQALEEVV